MSVRKQVWLGVLGLLSITGAGLLAKSTFFAQPACACGTNLSRQHAGTFARAQQAHFIEQGKFATAIKDLQLDIGSDATGKATATATTSIEIVVTDTEALTYVYSVNPANQTSVVSGVFVLPNDGVPNDDAAPTITVITCEAPTPEVLQAPLDAQTCASGTTPVQ